VTENCIPAQLQMFYNDEHAMTLGVRQINQITCLGTTTTNYPVSPMVVHPADNVVNPMTGATEAQGGTDTADRPMYPVMYITDTTANPNELAGDWQFGGTGIPPDAVFGTWKAAVKTVNKTVTPNTVTVTPDSDPAVNNWNLGPGSDPVPTPTPTNQGYGAECRWDLTKINFIAGHRYRLYFMVHDGDQNKVGGDVGQDCVYFTMAGAAPTATPTPTPTPTATPTATPGTIVAGGKTFSSKTVNVSFQNNTAVSQVLTALSMTWPQGTNGNLTKITMGGTTIYNTSTGNGSLNTSLLLGTTAQRTIAAGACGTLTFTFQNNVSTNSALYTGSATFNPFGLVTFLP
jgi:septal ring-binding cell division protein DamX